jgi:hypothetical protein
VMVYSTWFQLNHSHYSTIIVLPSNPSSGSVPKEHIFPWL